VRPEFGRIEDRFLQTAFPCPEGADHVLTGFAPMIGDENQNIVIS
jgi:hypothetical protein